MVAEAAKRVERTELRAGRNGGPDAVETYSPSPLQAVIESLSENCAGSCGEGPSRTGRRIPAAGCNDRANAGHRQKTRRPQGYRGKGRLASLLLGLIPLRASSLLAPRHPAFSPITGLLRNFQTGSKRLLLLLALLVAGVPPTTAAETNAPVTISLVDQWEQPAALHAPLERVTILTVADRAGAKQVNDWVPLLKKQFGTHIEFFAVADVRAVPAPLRGFVRRRFTKEYAHPIALDWQATVSDQLPVKAGAANLFILDRSGHVRFSATGPVQPETLDQLKDALSRLLRTSGTTPSTDKPASRLTSP